MKYQGEILVFIICTLGVACAIYLLARDIRDLCTAIWLDVLKAINLKK